MSTVANTNTTSAMPAAVSAVVILRALRFFAVYENGITINLILHHRYPTCVARRVSVVRIGSRSPNVAKPIDDVQSGRAHAGKQRRDRADQKRGRELHDHGVA